MSADNGIYVHEFADGWRVCHAQCIENIYWEADQSGYNQTELAEYFEKSSLYKTKDDAIKAAVDLAEEHDWMLEYGISIV